MAKKIVKLNFGNVIKTINNKKLRKLSALLNLAAPRIEIADNILNVYDDEGIATSYDILVDGVVMDTIEASKINLISFTLDGKEYQAEEGMAWEEWVASEYNTGKYRADGSHVSDEYSNPIENSADVWQQPTDHIIANESYNATSGTHSGGMN